MEFQEFIEYLPDPAIGLVGGSVCVPNESARTLLGVSGESEPTVETLFDEDPDLAERYADMLRHYPDVGGVVEGNQRHFDSDHTAVESLLEGRSFASTDPDFGIVVDGELRYFHLRRSEVTDDRSLVLFRDVTDLKDNERDLDFLRQILDRFLRHNLRNDLTVARGRAASVQRETEGELEQMAAEARDLCDEVLGTASKARAIEDAIVADELMPFDLPGVVEDAVDAVADEHGGEFAVDVPDERIEVNPEFPDAIADAVENGVVYNDDPTPRVEVTGEREGPWVVLSVADDGPGIPQRELDALVQRGETKLVHGSGAGLWLLDTVVRESGGDISYDVDDSGTTIRMHLPVAD